MCAECEEATERGIGEVGPAELERPEIGEGKVTQLGGVAGGGVDNLVDGGVTLREVRSFVSGLKRPTRGVTAPPRPD